MPSRSFNIFQSQALTQPESPSPWLSNNTTRKETLIPTMLTESADRERDAVGMEVDYEADGMQTETMDMDVD